MNTTVILVCNLIKVKHKTANKNKEIIDNEMKYVRSWSQRGLRRYDHGVVFVGAVFWGKNTSPGGRVSVEGISLVV